MEHPMHHPDNNAYVLHMFSFFTFDASGVSDVQTPLSFETDPLQDAAIHNGNGADEPLGGIWWEHRTDRWALEHRTDRWADRLSQRP